MLVFRKYLPDPLLNVGLIDRLLLFCLGVVFSSGAGMCSLHFLHILDLSTFQTNTTSAQEFLFIDRKLLKHNLRSLICKS